MTERRIIIETHNPVDDINLAVRKKKGIIASLVEERVIYTIDRIDSTVEYQRDFTIVVM